MCLPRRASILPRDIAANFDGCGLASLVAACCAVGFAPPRAASKMTDAIQVFAVHTGVVIYTSVDCSV